ncbi:MAG TPA: ABC transporter ATP-binding protein [Roseiflexaceae bacterium]|nr:ABC transporter ATP-binding protein [Roseiflexaceae bacterium]
MPIISLRDVTFTYAIGKTPALRNITLDVPAGQVLGVIGRAGAGKSTLCALCTGFVPHFYHGRLRGTAVVDGQDVVQHPVAELVRHVALVSSNPFSQISGARTTVYEEVGFGLENLGVPRAEMIERIDWALREMQIAHLRDRSPYALSGGQQQRMVIAAALAMRPPVLVLDEPTAQLDPPAAAELAGLLRELSREGTTIVVAEHHLEWVAELADRVVALDAGGVLADGPPDQVMCDPLLLERGVGWPRPALFAARAREQGRWPTERPLPVTLAGLVEGLRATDDERRTTDDGRRTAHDRELSVRASEASLVVGRSSLVKLEGVHFTYPSGVEALKGVSLALGPGERVALLGRNGAGKSTLLRHLNGLLRPSQGHVTVAGEDTRRISVARAARRVGLVFQDVRNQLFARTVREELLFGPRNLGYPPAQAQALAERALAALGLEDAADEHPYDLPSARRRLVAVAAVLAMDTDLLVLDEPTAGLDTAGVALLGRLTRELAARGKSVLVVSHDLNFCFEHLERIVLMRDGRIVLDSPRGELSPEELTLLDETVGLPLELRVARELGVPDR